MGFVRILRVETPEEAGKVWSNFLDLSERNQEQRVLAIPEKIENGSRFFLKEDQALVLFAGEKYVDSVVGPGSFVYLDVFDNGEYNEVMKKHTELLRGMKPEAFADGILGEELQEAFVIRQKEGNPITFTFDAAMYHDHGKKMDIVLQGSGYFKLKQADLLVNYALADYNKEKLLERDLPEFSEEEKKQFALDLENAFEKTLVKLSSLLKTSYDELPFLSEWVTFYANEELNDKWELGKGIMASTIQFNAFYPAEQCISALIQYEKARKAEQARAQAAKAQEEAQAAARAQQQAAQTQASAVNQQASNQTAQSTWQQNTATQQGVNYQQNVATQQQVYGSGDDGQEYTVKTGNCNWAKSSMEVQLGKATLTNKRFIYTMGKIGTLGNALLSSITGSDKNFEFFLSDIAEVREAKQGVAPSILFTLKNGQQYNCIFTKTMGMVWNTAEWLTQIHLVMQANGLQ